MTYALMNDIQNESIDGTPRASTLSLYSLFQHLGMKFAADFKEYLQEFGAASYGSHELTGFSTDKNLCVVEATQKNLKKHPTVKDLYVIEEAHIDGIVIWQDTDGNVYETYPHSEPRRIAHSLAEYIIG